MKRTTKDVTERKLDLPLSNCGECPLYNEGSYNPHNYWGNMHKPHILFIGEAPGKTEKRTGKVFQGRAGKFLQKKLKVFNIGNFAICNTVCCLEGSEIVRMADGSIKRINYLVKHKIKDLVLSFNQNTGEIESKKITNWYKNKLNNRELFRLINNENTKINSRGTVGTNLTEDHPLLTQQGWKPLKEIDFSSESIATNQLVPDQIGKEIIYGFILGDATLPKKTHLNISQREDHNDWIIQYSKAIGLPFKVNRYKGKKNWQTRINFKVNNFFKDCSIFIKESGYRKNKKRFPEFLIKQLSPLTLALWFMGDGSIKKREDSNRQPRVSIATKSWSENDRFRALKALKNLGLIGYISDKRIRFNINNSKKFSKLVAPYITNSMKYKLHPEHLTSKIEDKLKEIKNRGIKLILDFKKFRVEKVQPKNNAVYCIDVEDNHNFFTVNALVHNCRPEREDEYGNIKDRKPNAKETKFCAENLDAIIEQIKPKYIVPLGAVPLKRLKIKGSITNNRGILLEDTEYGKIFPMFHPSYILRFPSYVKEFDTDLKSLVTILKGKYKKPIPKVDCTVLEELDDVESLYRMLMEASHWSYDIETSGGFFPYRNTILGIGFSIKKGSGYYIPLMVKEDQEEPLSKDNPLVEYWMDNQQGVIELLSEIMQNDSKKIAHNGKFDNKCIEYHWDIKVNNLWLDTMLLHHIIEENKSHKLKQLAGYYFPEMKNYDEPLNEYLNQKAIDSEEYGDVPLEILGPYCCMDAEVTLRLSKVLFKQIDSKLSRLLFHFCMPLSRIYTQSETIGVKLDVPYVKKIIKKYTKLEASELAKVYKIAGKKFNLNSYKQMGEVLYKDLGFPIGAKTPTGNPSTDEATLKELPIKHKYHNIIKHILEYRGYNKMLSTYLSPMLEKMDDNHRIHPSFLIHGTVTGRLSSKGPNIQNIPRDSEIKGMFIAEKGYELIEIDYSQAELRVMAYYSKDSEMTKQYMNGEDIHLATASTIFKLPPEKITKQQRKYAKLTNFGGMYGASPKTLMKKINEKLDEEDRKITLKEAEKFRAGFFRRYKGIGYFIKKVHSHIRKNKEIENIFGRKRRLPQIDSPYEDKQAEALREGLNALIQGTASDLTQLSLIKVAKFLRKKETKTRFLFSVHDALILEGHKSERKHIKKLKELMEDTPKPFDFPMVAEVERFPIRWGTDSISME